MSKKNIIVEDETYGGALKIGLDKLGLTVDDVKIKVLQEGQSGFLGFLSRPYKLKISLKTFTDDDFNGSEEIKTNENSKNGVSKTVDKDFTFSLMNVEEGIFITVTEPRGNGKKPRFEELKAELLKMKLKNLDEAGLKSSITRVNFDMMIQIAPADPNFKVDRDGEILIQIDKDKMSCFCKITKSYGEGIPATLEKVVDKIRQEGVQADINEETVKEIFTKEKYDELIEVAQGLQAIHGTNAYINWMVNKDKDKIKISIDESGAVDFHKVLNISNVRAGEVVGRLVEQTNGVDGFNVFKNLIPAKPGRPVLLKPGKNVEISEDGLKFVANIDGQLLVNREIPSVLPVFEVRGNVDISTGDIEFVGNVIVHGDLEDGFEVKADGNVEVKGTVNCSRIEATGNIIILGGFMGKDKGEIISSKSIGLKFVENGIIKAEENIIVDRAIMHSEVSAGKKIEVKGKRGLIVGGNTTAGEEIIANTIGSHLGTRTIVSSGISLARKDKLIKLDKELEGVALNSDKLKKTIAFFDRIISTTGQLTDEQRTLYTKSESILSQLNMRRREIEENKITIEDGITGSVKGRIVANNIIYPGVTANIRQAVLMVNDVIKCSALKNDDGEIRIGII